MKGKGRRLPPNVVRLHPPKPRPPSTVAVIEGLKLMQVFLKIETGRDRKRVLELATQLAASDAHARR
jgi:hypothetical protein